MKLPLGYMRSLRWPASVVSNTRSSSVYSFRRLAGTNQAVSSLSASEAVPLPCGGHDRGCRRWCRCRCPRHCLHRRCGVLVFGGSLALLGRGLDLVQVVGREEARELSSASYTAPSWLMESSW